MPSNLMITMIDSVCIHGSRNIYNIVMSLPRIKTLHEAQSRNISSSKDLKVKFRKIALEQSDKESRKKSITVVRTERLKTLERFATLEQKREYKNQKIHLNLIERKLLTGTYDQKKETSSQLTSLKQKRDQLKVEMALKQKQIQKLKLLLEDARQSISLYMIKKGEQEQKLRQVKERFQAHQVKAESVRDSRAVLQHMIRRHQEVNLILGKRCSNLREQAEQLKATWTLVSIEQRQAVEKCANQQVKLLNTIEQSNRQRSERNDEIMKYQQKINKRKEGEVAHVQKSRQYVAHLDNLEYLAAQREFHQVYDKILPNIFLSRFAQHKMVSLMSKYSTLEKLYSEISSYKAFDEKDPANFVKRFFEHGPQNAKWQQQIRYKETQLTQLQQKSQKLRRQLKMIKSQLEYNNPPSKTVTQSQRMDKERERIRQLRKECEQLEQKYTRVKTYILKMLGKMHQRGEKQISHGIQVTVNNLSLLTKIVREAFKSLN